jgi:hypothetical protein
VTSLSPIGTLPDDQLLSRLHGLVRRGRALEAEMLAHLAEVDARRLYLGEGCPSMFAYCVGVLHFAESVAYKRIAAARAARQHPAILEAVRRGELHVTGVGLLAPQLTVENCLELIAAARHKTADEIRRVLADRQPRPDVATSIRHLRAAPMAPLEPAKDVTPPSPIGKPAAAPPMERTRSEPLGGDRYCVRFTADPELHAQIQELRALMRHQIPDGDVAKILARAVEVLLDQVRKRKFGETDKPRLKGRAGDRPSRHVPSRIRREIWKRDAGCCSYVSVKGRRCDTREFLEFHHRVPWARSQAHAVENLALRCRAHNQYEATRDFGERHMARFRRRASDSPTGFRSS